MEPATPPASNLGHVLDSQGELSEAARIFRETLEVQRRVLGTEHPHTLTSANDLVINDQNGTNGDSPLRIADAGLLDRSLHVAVHAVNLLQQYNV